MKNLKYILFISAITLLSACKKDPIVPCENNVVEDIPKSYIEVKVEGYMNGEPIEIQKDFLNINGNRSVIELINIYLSNVYLISSNNDSVFLKDIDLISFTKNKFGFKKEIEPGSFQNFTFGVGVPEKMNGMTDPLFDITQYPASHPLSLYNGTHWTWNTGYRFMMLEGRIDTTLAGNGTFTETFAYHPGLDELYRSRTHNFAGGLVVNQGERKTITISFEFNELFNINNAPLDMIEHPTSHATPNDIYISRGIIENFTNLSSITVN
jgi:hypothetical protein